MRRRRQDRPPAGPCPGTMTRPGSRWSRMP